MCGSLMTRTRNNVMISESLVMPRIHCNIVSLITSQFYVISGNRNMSYKVRYSFVYVSDKIKHSKLVAGEFLLKTYDDKILGEIVFRVRFKKYENFSIFLFFA